VTGLEWPWQLNGTTFVVSLRLLAAELSKVLKSRIRTTPLRELSGSTDLQPYRDNGEE